MDHRIRRCDLYSPRNSPQDETSQEEWARYLEYVNDSFEDGNAIAVTESLCHIEDIDVSSTGLGKEFRLFSSAQPVIVQHDDDELYGQSLAKISWERPNAASYYFALPSSPARRDGFERMALSGEEVQRRALDRAWGLEVPWRVSVAVSGQNCFLGHETATLTTTKKKPGKRSRIILRERAREAKRVEEAGVRLAAEKNLLEREKKTLRNRDKKLKKRQKEKAKKTIALQIDHSPAAGE